MPKEFLHKLNNALVIHEQRGLVLRPGIIRTLRRTHRRYEHAEERTIGGNTIVADHIAIRPYGLKIGIGYRPNRGSVPHRDYYLRYKCKDVGEFFVAEQNPEWVTWKEHLGKLKGEIDQPPPGDDWEDIFANRGQEPRKFRCYPLFDVIITMLEKNVASLEWT